MEEFVHSSHMETLEHNIYDCVLCYILTLLLSLTAICHIDDICYFTIAIHDDVSPSIGGLSVNFKRRSLVQG